MKNLKENHVLSFVSVMHSEKYMDALLLELMKSSNLKEESEISGLVIKS